MMDLLLNGKGSTERIVGLATCQIDTVTCYGKTEEERKVRPLIWINEKDTHLVKDNFTKAVTISLDGDGYYNVLVVCSHFSQYWRMRRFLKQERVDFYTIPNLETQYLLQSGETLFGGMAISDTRRMQIDIEVYSDEGFVNSQRPDDKIIIVSLSDNRGWEKVLALEGPTPRPHVQIYDSERELLIGIIKHVHRVDPDILEFHNGFGFDLPYIRDRCELHGVRFAIGRDSSVPNSYKTTKKFAEKDIDFENFQVAGRAVIDTMFLCMDYDVYKRSMPSYSLKEAAKFLNVVPEGRTYVEGADIARIWNEHPDTLIEYALDDVRETRAISEFLLPATFELTKIVPFTLQRTHLSGSAGKLECVLVREYLRQRKALPKGDESNKTVSGGYTETFQQGAFGNRDLVLADVESLYPSIMLQYEIAPKGDYLKLFTELLRSLTDKRFEAKRAMKAAKNNEIRERKDAEQNAYKILINSHYGMCGFPFSIFSDLEAADLVTTTGRELVKRLKVIVERLGGTPMLSDTDSCLFQLPDGANADDFISSVNGKMPEGIVVGNDGEYDRVFIYKPKNYVLKDLDGKLTIKGQSLKGRSMEPFAAKYLLDIVKCFLDGEDIERMKEIHDELKFKIFNGEWNPSDFRKKSTLKDSLIEYDMKLETNPNKHPQAQYEIAKRLLGGGRDVRRGDIIYWYVSRDWPRRPLYNRAKEISEWKHNDESTEHYLERLKTLTKRWKPFFTGGEINRIFSMSLDQTLSLF